MRWTIEREDLVFINGVVAKYCFQCGSDELIQFIETVNPVTLDGREVMAISCQAPKSDTDSWEDWYRRCLTGRCLTRETA